MVHKGDKPHTCEKCKKTFIEIKYLKTHMVVHTDERPFKCAQCPKMFKFHNGLKRHLQCHLVMNPLMQKSEGVMIEKGSVEEKEDDLIDVNLEACELYCNLEEGEI